MVSEGFNDEKYMHEQQEDDEPCTCMVLTYFGSRCIGLIKT
jgi:hypothetical protein